MSILPVNLNAVSDLVGFVERYPDLLVLTGAGLSTASGIPDYRDRNGVRKGNPPIFGRDFLESIQVRKRYWARSMAGWPIVNKAEPNAAHCAVAQLEAMGKIAGVITQNVDGLHHRAGSSNVIELHGNIHQVICRGCDRQFSRQSVQAILEVNNPALSGPAPALAPDGDAHLQDISLENFVIPKCSECAGVLKPAVVFFGEDVPRWRAEAAKGYLERAQALLVIGTSLMAFSSYRLCLLAEKLSKPIAALNLGKTRADHLFILKIEKKCETVLPSLADSLRV